jgi:hypothetical protein
LPLPRIGHYPQAYENCNWSCKKTGKYFRQRWDDKNFNIIH